MKKMHLSLNNIYEYPVCVSWEITSNCNYSCIHCRMDDYIPDLKKIELSFKEIIVCIDELASIGVKQINYSGGEPFFRSDFLDILRYTEKKGLSIGITTNGYFIDSSISKKLSSIKTIDLIQVSIDGKDKHTHDFIRNMDGAFERAISAIKNLVASGIRTGAVTTVMQLNRDQIVDILDMIMPLGVKSFGARRFMPVGRGSQFITDLTLTKEQYKEHCILWTNLIKEHGDDIQLYIEEPLLGILQKNLPKSWIFSGCVAGTIYGAITSYGDVRPCIFIPESIGNIRNNTFSDIWKTSEVLSIFSEKKLNGKCGVCDLKNICGGCRAMAYFKNSDLQADDPLCFYSGKTLS